MSINAIKTAIYSQYNNNAPLKAAITGFHFEEAPERRSYPYIVYHLDALQTDRAFGGVKSEEFLCQFDIYDDDSSSEGAGDVFGLLETAFDFQSLSYTGYSSIVVRRDDPPRTFHDEDIWNVQADYMIRARKS